MQIKTETDARLFFALWPDTDLRQRLHALALEYQPQCDARVMRPESLHMTLQFMGAVSRERLPCLLKAAAAVTMPAFAFKLDALWFWRHNHIGYAAPSEELTPVDQLVASLRFELTSAGFQFEQRAFNPHVTLLRNVKHVLELQPLHPMVWKVNAFVLVESEMTELGFRYRILHEWPLISG